MLRLVHLLSTALLMGGAVQGADIRVLFDTRAPNPSPFPADTLTVADPAQKTGLVEARA